MYTHSRRVFMLHAVVGTTALAAQGNALAQAAAAPAEPVSKEAVKETDAYPKSMGFKLTSANVDKVKFPRHDATQKCSNCQLYSGKEGDPLGPCSFFKRMVPPEGWCRNFKVKKAA